MNSPVNTQEDILRVNPHKINLWLSAPPRGDQAGAVLSGDWDVPAQSVSPDPGATPANGMPDSDEPLAAGINRDGRFVLFDRPERLASVRAAGVDEVPVRVVVRHQEWVDFKDEIRASGEYGDGQIYQAIFHPDLGGIKATKSTRRIELLHGGLAGYDCQGKRLLDIGANWGHMSQQMEELGFECTALELSDDAVRMATKIRAATESHFTIWQGDFRNYPDPRADVTIALNIFHHVVKTEGSHAMLVDFLRRLETEILFFQTARPDEEQMQAAFANYEQREFAEFVAEHARLSTVEVLGTAEHKREMFKLSR
jgi:2-polyprenyl-3-methyl-5-hydroxy-6-metoxy-1,4-benzoquinol methylase